MEGKKREGMKNKTPVNFKIPPNWDLTAADCNR